jgi:apolipoprotein N-acyltransferase
MEPITDPAVSQTLLDRHRALSTQALQNWEIHGRINNASGNLTHSNWAQGYSAPGNPPTIRLVIWPESPMNFAYGNDRQLREALGDFARSNRTSILFNSLESAPQGGDYNSALLLNEEGQLSAQYDKIRLMPFGEYVPLPRWIPGSSVITPLVGGFTAGTKYHLMPVGQTRAGVFICFESTFPETARAFTNAGASVLINISNDGYLGPTPVMRQHLANSIFRAVENNRPVVRVTNTGLTAYINANGEVLDTAESFQPTARTWAVWDADSTTFYTRYGEVFVTFCALITLIALAAVESRRRRSISPGKLP